MTEDKSVEGGQANPPAGGSISRREALKRFALMAAGLAGGAALAAVTPPRLRPVQGNDSIEPYTSLKPAEPEIEYFSLHKRKRAPDGEILPYLSIADKLEPYRSLLPKAYLSRSFDLYQSQRIRLYQSQLIIPYQSLLEIRPYQSFMTAPYLSQVPDNPQPIPSAPPLYRSLSYSSFAYNSFVYSSYNSFRNYYASTSYYSYNSMRTYSSYYSYSSYSSVRYSSYSSYREYFSSYNSYYNPPYNRYSSTYGRRY